MLSLGASDDHRSPLRAGWEDFYDLESHQSCKIKGLGFVTARDWVENSMESMKSPLDLIFIVN